MRVILEKQPLLEALSHQQSLVERRSTSPILTHVLLEAKRGLDGADGTLSLKGTDLELSLVETIPAQVEQEGKTTVSAHTFHDIVRKLSGGGPIILAQALEGAQGLDLKSGRAEFTLPTLSVEEYPPIHPHTLPHTLKILGPHLKQLIEDTRFSMSSEEARCSLNGVYFHPEGEQWRAVATDAHRLAMSWLPFPAETMVDFPSILIGRKSIQEINKLLEDWKEEVFLSFSTQQIMLQFGRLIFSSRLLEGRFPQYWEAIPKDHAYSIMLDVKKFAQSLDRVGMVSSEKQGLVKFSFAPGEVTLSARSQQYGSGLEVLSIPYQGPPLVLGFNPRYLLDICHHIKGEMLELQLKDELSQAVVLDPTDPRTLFVLMPVRL